jgi:type I restriction enzyme R subunit
MNRTTETDLELSVIEQLETLGYGYKYGLDISPDSEQHARQSFADVVFAERLLAAIVRLNPNVPDEAREQALKKVLRLPSPAIELLPNNEAFHKMLTDGVDVEYRKEGGMRGDKVWLVDFTRPDKNDFLAVNQFTVIENNRNKRPDLVLFINGLPLVVIELKNPADEKATVAKAYDQLQTYKEAIPTLFHYNEILIASDGYEARAGTITSGFSRFMQWKTEDGKTVASTLVNQMEIMLRGMLNKQTLLDLIRHFIVFERSKQTEKKIAAYHQYYAVNKALIKTQEAASAKGDKRAGVVWHTQGSGKSLSMIFYAGKLVQGLDNPTIVVLTDRNDLDQQLYDTFSNCKQLLRQPPVQAESAEQLKKLLRVASGGIVFTTIQKFFPDEKGGVFPTLSERRNIVVIADEAHRSQYDFIDGFARHIRDALPNASFIGFTGTPIETTDKNTRAVFGEYIDIYDIKQSVEDNATVRIYYESRLAKVHIKEEEKENLDVAFDKVAEPVEPYVAEEWKTKWAQLEKIVGEEKRIAEVAKDIVQHFEARDRTSESKGMIICMARWICLELYNAIIKLRPEWHDTDDKKGVIKIIMTGASSDPLAWQQHVRNKEARKAIGDRLKDADDPLKLVIVCSMWLTGFDAPVLNTLYIDKPMHGHNLMQAIARVNRVYKDKKGGLIVDYIGIASDLKQALAVYTESGGQGKPVLEQEEAVGAMIERYEIVCQIMHGFDYKRYAKARSNERMNINLAAEEHILKQENGKERFIKEVTALSQAFALSVPNPKALAISDDVGFFQELKARLMKFNPSTGTGKDQAEMETTIKQIVSKAIVTEGVIDIFDAAGIKKPDLSILSDEFLQEIRGMQHKNVAMELLKKLLNDEIKIRSRKNLVQSRKFSEMLENTIHNYQNKLLSTAEIINELIEIAKEVKDADRRGEKLNLNESELAFYDALETNDSAVKVLGDETLRTIAREIADKVRNNTGIDWMIKESARANLRRLVKRTLNAHGYPPDKQEQAVDTVLKQAEMMAEEAAG